MAEYAEKFSDCARVAAKTLPEANIEKVIRMIGQLEQIDDVAQTVKLLVA